MKLDAYVRLMRLDKPVGVVLLWIPTAWALWLAKREMPPIDLLFYFFLGTILMRTAGCVVNDVADRNIDKHVKRTKKRPLTCGEISLVEALLTLGVLLIAAFWIVLQLPISCLFYAFFALLITTLYPFCKRVIQAPQLVLGIAFSMGIPMVYAALRVPFDASMVVLMTINFVWIVSYDTMYAMVDRKDDLQIGVKSTAVLFARFDGLAIAVLQISFHGLWLLLAQMEDLSYFFYGFWVLAAWVLLKLQQLVNTRQPDLCFSAFLRNGWYGLIMWIGLMIGLMPH